MGTCGAAPAHNHKGTAETRLSMGPLHNQALPLNQASRLYALSQIILPSALNLGLLELLRIHPSSCLHPTGATLAHSPKLHLKALVAHEVLQADLLQLACQAFPSQGQALRRSTSMRLQRLRLHPLHPSIAWLGWAEGGDLQGQSPTLHKSMQRMRVREVCGSSAGRGLAMQGIQG